MDKKELKEIRKQKFTQMEQQLKEIHPKEEDSIFYYHSSEDRIVLSHALFWTMTMPSLSWLQALVVTCPKSWLLFS